MDPQKNKEASHLLTLRGKHQCSDQHSSRMRASCVASAAAGTEGMPLPQREQLMEESRDAKRLLMKREKRTGSKTRPCGTLRWNYGKRNGLILINHASALIRKKKLSPSKKQGRGQPSRNKLIEENRTPDKIKSFKEVHSRTNRPRDRLRFVKSI